MTPSASPKAALNCVVARTASLSLGTPRVLTRCLQVAWRVRLYQGPMQKPELQPASDLRCWLAMPRLAMDLVTSVTPHRGSLRSAAAWEQSHGASLHAYMQEPAAALACELLQNEFCQAAVQGPHPQLGRLSAPLSGLAGLRTRLGCCSALLGARGRGAAAPLACAASALRRRSLSLSAAKLFMHHTLSCIATGAGAA